MIAHRVIVSTLVALTAPLVAAAPAMASAGGTLLSGYGAPGDGSQVVLGATVLNGPSGGGSGGGGSAGPGGESQNSASSRAGAGRAPAGGAQSSVPNPAGRGREATNASGAASGGSGARVSTSGLARSETVSGSSPLLGVSGADLLYVVLGVTALGLAGAATWRLAGPGRHNSTPAG